MLGAPRRIGGRTTMKARTLGWLVSLVLGVVLLGATGSDDANGIAQAAGEPTDAAGAAAAGTATASRATPAVKAPSKAKTNDEVQASTTVKVTSTPAPIEAVSGVCPNGMTEVEGDYCSHVEETCLRWLDPEEKLRCAEFAPATRCEGKTTHKHYCIDDYEYPNEPGAKPVVMKTWYEARDACSAEGKRMCGDSEWTLACEGQERMPYPYGYARNADACNIDKPHPDVDEKAIANPVTREAEVERLWQGEPSGAREACVSPYGVHDMTGNVDEWVVNESAKPYKSGLKGGYWGPVRDRCRPMTTAHNEDFSFYQIGFRCCSDAQAPSSSPTSTPKPAASPAAPSGHGGVGGLGGVGVGGGAATSGGAQGSPGPVIAGS
ncbi:MAG: formylglycine-generating enzyme family protein [Polyangiaceae bacterium]